MTEISGLYNYEQLHRLELVRPDTEEPLGIVFMLRSASSPEVKKIIRKQLDDVTERQQRGKLVKGAMRLQHELQKAAAYIASWDWGEHTYHGEVPVLSVKKAAEILEAEDWMYVQVTEAATNLANFTTRSDASADASSD